MMRFLRKIWTGALLCWPLGFCGCALIGGLLPYAGIKMYFACIPEHTLVDTPSGQQAIETLEAGDTVIGYSGKPVRILQKHCYLENPESVFLRISFTDGAAVDLCRMHRLAGVRACNIQVGQTIAGRCVMSITARRGEVRSYDLLTEDAGYRIQGVMINSMIEEMHTSAFFGIRPR